MVMLFVCKLRSVHPFLEHTWRVGRRGKWKETGVEIEYDNLCVNILDTPGHQDFSEDTYRALAAADNAVMLLDTVKGLEPQTRKLFEVTTCDSMN